MKNEKLNLTFLILIATWFIPQISTAQEEQIVVSYGVFSNNGSVISNSQYRIAGTLGQPLIDVAQSSTKNNIGFWYLTNHLPKSGFQESTEIIPEEFHIEQNYPNPFNPKTIIKYNLPKKEYVKVQVFDILGKEIAVLEEGYKEAGYYEIEFDGRKYSSGVYIYSISTSEKILLKKMLLLK